MKRINAFQFLPLGILAAAFLYPPQGALGIESGRPVRLRFVMREAESRNL